MGSRVPSERIIARHNRGDQRHKIRRKHMDKGTRGAGSEMFFGLETSRCLRSRRVQQKANVVKRKSGEVAVVHVEV